MKRFNSSTFHQASKYMFEIQINFMANMMNKQVHLCCSGASFLQFCSKIKFEDINRAGGTNTIDNSLNPGPRSAKMEVE